MINSIYNKIIIITILLITFPSVAYPNKFNNNITKRFISILSEKVKDSKSNLNKIRYEYLRAFYDNEFENEESYDIYKEEEKQIFISDLFKAASDLSKDIKLCRRLKRIRYKIKKYCIIEYSKGESGKAEFYIPGDMDNNLKGRKEYRISISSFNPNDESADMDLKVNLNILFLKTNTTLFYSFIEKEHGIIFSNELIDSFMNTKFSIKKKISEEHVYLLTTEVNF